MFYDNFRQQNDTEYQKILDEIRNNNLSIESIETLLSRTKQDTTDMDIQPTIIYPLKRQVDKYNNEQFEKLLNETSDNVKTYSTIFMKYNKKTRAYDTINKTAKTNQPIINKCINSVLVDDNIRLLVGTRVMCVANIDIENNLVNGSQGIIIGFENNLPLVEFKVGKHKFVRKIEYYEWTMMDDQYMVKQLPLIMSWAITIHKSQGVTLNCARINIGSSIFEYGQIYVALSRVSSIDGLYLDAVNINKIKTNPKVVRFYKSLNN
jgi:ATP-dependent DNA helicase PIF1